MNEYPIIPYAAGSFASEATQLEILAALGGGSGGQATADNQVTQIGIEGNTYNLIAEIDAKVATADKQDEQTTLLGIINSHTNDTSIWTNQALPYLSNIRTTTNCVLLQAYKYTASSVLAVPANVLFLGAIDNSGAPIPFASITGMTDIEKLFISLSAAGRLDITNINADECAYNATPHNITMSVSGLIFLGSKRF